MPWTPGRAGAANGGALIPPAVSQPSLSPAATDHISVLRGCLPASEVPLESPEGALQRGSVSMATCHVTSGWQRDPVVALEALASRPLVSVSSPERALGCTAARVHFGTAALPAEVRHPFGSAARRSADAALLERLLGALGSAVFCACFVGNSMGARDSVVELQFREDDASRAALHAFLDAGVWECTIFFFLST